MDGHKVNKWTAVTRMLRVSALPSLLESGLFSRERAQLLELRVQARLRRMEGEMQRPPRDF